VFLLVATHPGSPGQRAAKWSLCVRVSNALHQEGCNGATTAAMQENISNDDGKECLKLKTETEKKREN